MILFFAVATLYLVAASFVPDVECLPAGNQLLTGQGLGFFDSVVDAKKSFRRKGLKIPRKIDVVTGTKLAQEGDNESVGSPGNPLLTGNLVKEYNRPPSKKRLLRDTNKTRLSKIQRVEGKQLSDDVKTASYVSNPAETLGNLLARGENLPKVVEGEILAGDPAELNVLTRLYKNKN